MLFMRSVPPRGHPTAGFFSFWFELSRPFRAQDSGGTCPPAVTHGCALRALAALRLKSLNHRCPLGEQSEGKKKTAQSLGTLGCFDDIQVKRPI